MTVFDCDCSIDHGEVPAVMNAIMRKARKQHICGECGKDIAPGETYEYVTGLWEGGWDSFKTCISCVGIRNTLCSGGWIFGEVNQQIREACGIDYVTGEMSEWLMEHLAEKYAKGEHIPDDVVKLLKKEEYL